MTFTDVEVARLILGVTMGAGALFTALWIWGVERSAKRAFRLGYERGFERGETFALQNERRSQARERNQ